MPTKVADQIWGGFHTSLSPATGDQGCRSTREALGPLCFSCSWKVLENAPNAGSPLITDWGGFRRERREEAEETGLAFGALASIRPGPDLTQPP